jgi:hypothetical protein
MNNIHKFFDDFSKLFYWLLILTSWLLTADIIGNLFLSKSINDIFTKINISDLLMIFMFQIMFILTSVVIYNLIKIIKVFVFKINSIDNTDKKNYYTSSELLNNAIKTNNQTMYNYYKDYKDEHKFDLNQKYLCFTVILLVILSISVEKSILRIIFEDFYSFTIIKKGVIVLVTLFNFIALLFMLDDDYNSYYTNIKKSDSVNDFEK